MLAKLASLLIIRSGTRSFSFSNLSIIAIHGLDGHPIESWEAGPGGKLWLKDFLPGDVRRARILTYGYDAYTRNREQLTDQSIYSHAENLVALVAANRRNVSQ